MQIGLLCAMVRLRTFDCPHSADYVCDVWAARCRVETALKEKTTRLEAEVKRKAQQADACLSTRHTEIQSRRLANGVWRVPGSRERL